MTNENTAPILTEKEIFFAADKSRIGTTAIENDWGGVIIEFVRHIEAALASKQVADIVLADLLDTENVLLLIEKHASHFVGTRKSQGLLCTSGDVLKIIAEIRITGWRAMKDKSIAHSNIDLALDILDGMIVPERFEALKNRDSAVVTIDTFVVFMRRVERRLKEVVDIEAMRDAALEEAANAVASTITLGMTAGSATTKLCAVIRALKSSPPAPQPENKP